MSKFYGTVSGAAKTPATRTGNSSSGIIVRAASWNGAIEVYVYEDPSTGREKYRVSRIPWEGSGADKAGLIQEGEL